MAERVAALFVAIGGCYFNLPDVDPWDITRDARKYSGLYPVVAHPPCERWGRYWGGGPRLQGTLWQKKLGDDGGCFASALASVRQWGGVLEHPEASYAFAAHGLQRPKWREGWIAAGDGVGHICCVAQGNYGHRARKLTWLYANGVDRLPELDWSIPSGVIALERLGGKERAATPIPFRDLLLDLARQARR